MCSLRSTWPANPPRRLFWQQPSCSALRRLERSFEDALPGVEAGNKGNFGLVIGVARKGNSEEFRRRGAHLVVSDLSELVDCPNALPEEPRS